MNNAQKYAKCSRLLSIPDTFSVSILDIIFSLLSHFTSSIYQHISTFIMIIINVTIVFKMHCLFLI